ncbi:MAG: UPF0104 family protein [Thermoleophilaceae bacterium]|nr:UPF0104 family protein [Thermoleophilaceae bacterium]
MIGRAVLLTVTAVSLYLLAPALVDTFSSWPQLRGFSWLAFLLMFLLKTASFVSMWLLGRIVLGVHAWRPVALSQLAGNAFGRVVPGGAAAAGAMQVRMLRDAGVATQRGISGLAASNLLTSATLLALPLLTIPVILTGAPVSKDLTKVLWFGALALVLLFAFGAVLLATDRPLLAIGRGAQRVRNRLKPKREPLDDLPTTLIDERNLVRSMVGERWWEALGASIGWWIFDFGVLFVALEALNVHVRISLMLIAYCTANLLGTIPLTPGGLGFVELGLTGMLTLAGVNAGDALVATLAYRLFNFWLPLPVGGVAAWVYRRHHPLGAGDPAAAD